MIFKVNNNQSTFWHDNVEVGDRLSIGFDRPEGGVHSDNCAVERWVKSNLTVKSMKLT